MTNNCLIIQFLNHSRYIVSAASSTRALRHRRRLSHTRAAIGPSYASTHKVKPCRFCSKDAEKVLEPPSNSNITLRLSGSLALRRKIIIIIIIIIIIYEA